MLEAIIMLSLLNLLLLLALRQRNRDNRNLEKTLDRTESELASTKRELEAGKETILDLGASCKELQHQRNYYREALTASEKKRQELVEKLRSLPEGGAKDDVQT